METPEPLHISTSALVYTLVSSAISVDTFTLMSITTVTETPILVLMPLPLTGTPLLHLTWFCL